jgi:hypothetical protein
LHIVCSFRCVALPANMQFPVTLLSCMRQLAVTWGPGVVADQAHASQN